MEKWTEDIQMAIALAEKSNGPTPELLASSPPDNSKWWGMCPRPQGLPTWGEEGLRFPGDRTH